MKKYAKIVNEQTKQCDVGVGTNSAYYESIDMIEIDVEQAYNGQWYVTGYAPKKPPKTEEELDREKAAIRAEKIDQYTLRRMRKMANGTWTEEDEQEYLLLDAEVTGYIEERFPNE